VIASPIRCNSFRLLAGTAIVFGAAALAMAPRSALADAQVRGTLDAVSIEAKNTSVGEVLSALSTAFDLHYRSSANLDNPLDRRYEGSLRSVMKNVLEGYSYIVKTGAGGIDLTVLDAPRVAPIPETAPLFHVVGSPVDAVAARISPVIAAAESPATPPSLAASSSTVSSSFDVAGLDGDAREQPSRGINLVEHPSQTSTPVPHRRDHLFGVDEKQSWLLPPRIRIVGNSRRLKKLKHHVRRTHLAQASAFCTRRVNSSGQKMAVQPSSYSWHSQELLQSPNWYGEATGPRPQELKMSCRSKHLRALAAMRLRAAHQ
jgi:hypothetical protein